MEYIGIAIVVLFGFGTGMLLLGWIIPLVIAGSLKNKGIENVRGWKIFAGVWGALAIIAILGAVSFCYLAFTGFSRNFNTKSSGDFSPEKYSGPTTTVKSDYTGEASMTASVDGKDTKTFGTTNGVFTTPAAKLKISQYSLSGCDSSNAKWTIRSKYWNNVEIEPKAGEDYALKVGPPFTAGVKMDWSSASKSISISPVCYDRDGNEYQISSDSKSSAPSFEFLDLSGKVVWSGKFTAG